MVMFVILNLKSGSCLSSSSERVTDEASSLHIQRAPEQVLGSNHNSGGLHIFAFIRNAMA
jgi:hypothetical protein